MVIKLILVYVSTSTEARMGAIHSGLQEFVIITGKNKFRNLRNPPAWALGVRPELLFFFQEMHML